MLKYLAAIAVALTFMAQGCGGTKLPYKVPPYSSQFEKEHKAETELELAEAYDQYQHQHATELHE